MPRVELRAGAAIDILNERELRGALEDLRRGLRQAFRECPTARHLTGDCTIDAAGTGTIDLGTPPPGFELDVRRIAVNGEVPLTAVAGSALLLVGRPGGFTPAYNVADFVPAATGFPSVGFYDPEELIVGAGLSLLLVFSGVAATTRMFANATALERASTQEQTPVPEYAANGHGAG